MDLDDESKRFGNDSFGDVERRHQQDTRYKGDQEFRERNTRKEDDSRRNQMTCLPLKIKSDSKIF